MGGVGGAVQAVLALGFVLSAPAIAHEQARTHSHKSSSESRLWVDAQSRKLHRDRTTLTKIARRALPSVASITTRSPESEGSSMLGEPQKGIGSGFVIHPDGLIVTASHVIEDAGEITVTLQTREGFAEEYTARVLGKDPTTDIALLKIDPSRKLPVLKLGSAAQVLVADWVVVIGNPFGLSHSVTVGVVSYIGRTEVTPSGRDGQFDYIQTDASINPGNSGGPVLNLRGEVIAIANAVNVSGQGIAFAVPIDVAKAVVPHLEAHGRVRRGYMGAGVQDITPSVAKTFGIPVRKGVVVAHVESESPAARAGLEVGDVITEMDKGPVQRAHVLRWKVSTRGPESPLRLKILRKGKAQEIKVVLAPLPDEESIPEEADAQLEAELGAMLVDPSDGSGAEVSSIAPGSPLAEAGLAEGDVVLRVNDMAVQDAGALSQLLVGATAGQELKLFIQRGDRSLALPFRRP